MLERPRRTSVGKEAPSGPSATSNFQPGRLSLSRGTIGRAPFVLRVLDQRRREQRTVRKGMHVCCLGVFPPKRQPSAHTRRRSLRTGRSKNFQSGLSSYFYRRGHILYRNSLYDPVAGLHKDQPPENLS